MSDVVVDRESVWRWVRDERARLADDLADLTEQQWRATSDCGRWTVEDVVAHLAVGGRLGRVGWLRSVLAARFDFDLHNDRRLAEVRGPDPAQTLAGFREVVESRRAPASPTAAWLAEVVVHGQDVRRPLGIRTLPQHAATTAVAEFLASRDFTVPSRTRIMGLRLRAVDGAFVAGDGPLVEGDTLDLVMTMAGRDGYVDRLTGPGVATLRTRLPGG